MSSYSELAGFLRSLLTPVRGNMGKTNIFSNIKTVLTSFMKPFFSIHYFSFSLGTLTREFIFEFFSNHSMQGAYELSVLWVKYTRYNQNPQIKVSVVNIFGEGNGTPLQYCCLENPMEGGAWWVAVRGVATSWTQLSDFTFIFHFQALEKEMATHSSVLDWRIPGMVEPGGLPSMRLHRVGHD